MKNTPPGVLEGVLKECAAAAVVFAFTASFAIAGNNAAGHIESNVSGSRYISAGDTVALEADPSRLVKGDRLDISVNAKNGGPGAQAGSHIRKAGQLVVTSGPGGKPMGIVTSAGMEIEEGAQVEFAFPGGAVESPYLPFIRALAGEFIKSPPQPPLRVAFVDVVNPRGESTAAGGAVFNSARRALCGRPQFDCAAQEKVAETLWRNGASTSRALSGGQMEEMAAALDVEVMVNGYLRAAGGMAELVLSATGPANAGRPPLWMKLAIGMDEAGGAQAFDKVTVPFRRAPRGHLKITLGTAPKIEGLTAEYVEYAELDGWIRSLPGGHAQTGGYYTIIGGKKRMMDAGGILFDGDVAAGNSPVTIGFHPAAVPDGNVSQRPPEPVEKTFGIPIAENERVEMTVYGNVENGVAVIAGRVE